MEDERKIEGWLGELRWVVLGESLIKFLSNGVYKKRVYMSFYALSTCNVLGCVGSLYQALAVKGPTSANHPASICICTYLVARLQFSVGFLRFPSNLFDLGKTRRSTYDKI